MGTWLILGLVFSVLFVQATGRELGYSAPPTGQPPDAVQLNDGAIVSSSGERIDVKAAVWNGAQSHLFSSFVHIDHQESAGNSSSISKALVAAAYQLRRQGYNAVYLPFSFSDLQGSSSSSSAKRCAQVSLSSLGKGSTGSQRAAGGSSSADWLKELALQGGTAASNRTACLSLLPNTTTLDRYLWSVQWFLANGLYVIMSSDVGSTTGPGVRCSNSGCIQDTAAVAHAWGWLWNAVVALPHFDTAVQGRVMLQLANDPNSSLQQWGATETNIGQKQPGLQKLYLAILAAVDQMKPGSALFILQGPQQQEQGPDGRQWGTGFSAGPSPISQNASDPTPFFKALSSKPYRSQIILAPRISSTQPSNSSSSSGGGQRLHLHSPPTFAGQHFDEHQATGPAPIKVLDNSFNQLSQTGFCVSEDKCFKFPVAVMQQGLGSAEQQQSGDSAQADLQLFADFVLNTQAHQQAVPEEAVTGSWYQWDLLAATAELPKPKSPAGQSSRGQPGQKKGSNKASSGSSTSSKAAAATPPHPSIGEREGILGFVYSADSSKGGKEGSTIIRDLQADDTQY